jgi:teichuronopeptide biosynthesis TupA-like protein
MDFLDRWNVSVRYRLKMGRWPDLENPTRFTEKIQVAKLVWRNREISVLSDKVAVKPIVAKALGDEWVTPSLFAGPRLPPRDQRNWPVPFVIKAGHASGRTLFVLHRKDLNWGRIERKVAGWLRRSYGRKNCEWAYRDIEPNVLVEPHLGGDSPPDDLKFFTFDGRVEFIWRVSGRYSNRTSEIYDLDWNRVSHTIRRDLIPAKVPAPRPRALKEMIEAAEFLAAPFPFVRIDFYELDHKPRFGEFTFYPYSGHHLMSPSELDLYLGGLCPDRLPDPVLPY